MKHIFSAILIFFIRIYQYTISPLLGANCRFTPTCSAYTIQAIQEWGAVKGIWLGIKRLIRCHPWGGHGHDPVPPKGKPLPPVCHSRAGDSRI